MVMVFAGGRISGAHYNPAVSFAALLVRAFVRPATPAVLGSDWQILVGELIFTLALAYAVVNVTSAVGTKGNSFYGLADWVDGRHGNLCGRQDDGWGVQPPRRVGW